MCPTKLLWTRVRFSIVSTLMDTTLADLLPAPLPATALPLVPSAKRIPAGAGGAAKQHLPTPTIA